MCLLHYPPPFDGTFRLPRFTNQKPLLDSQNSFNVEPKRCTKTPNFDASELLFNKSIVVVCQFSYENKFNQGPISP